MKGDFSRQTANPRKHYSGVLMQQGRVQLDADWNEQLAISLHRTQAEAQDVIGPGAAPYIDGGFQIGFASASYSDLTISPGRMYVDGILCELEATSIPIAKIRTTNAPAGGSSAQVQVWSVDDREFQSGQWVEISATQGGKALTALVQVVSVDVANLLLTFPVDITKTFQQTDAPPRLRRIPTYLTQPDYPHPDYTSISSTTQLPVLDLSKLPPNSLALVYLDVWERHITWLDDKYIREVALNGTDTTTRIQVVQQVRILPVAIPPGSTPTCNTPFPAWDMLVAPSTGTLNAQTTLVSTTDNLCLPSPSSGYQRLDNQLYRVEIHQGGNTSKGEQVTYKSSRDNGSVVIAIDSFNGSDIIVKEVGLDDVLGFANTDGQTVWGEIVDDASELQGLAGQRPLVQIQYVDSTRRTITLSPPPTPVDPSLHPKLRRWDLVGIVSTDWQDLESGIQLQFSPGTYKSGDYWLIPARTTTGQIEWAQDSSARPIPQPPLGITHSYCRLALLQPGTGAAASWSVTDCRRSFPSLTSPLAMHITNTNWQNDDFFSSDQLIDQGLQLALDTNLDSALLSQAAISVSLEQPTESYVFGSFDLTIKGTARVTGHTITWTWDHMNKGTLIQALLGIMNTFQFFNTQRAPYMRVRVQGHAVSTQQGNQSVYLDGQAFGRAGIRQDKTTACTSLTFPTGDRVAASDFESWFLLVPPPLQITTINLLDTKTQPPTYSAAGPITMPPAPTQALPVLEQNMNAIEITFNRPVVPANLQQQITVTYSSPFSIIFREAIKPPTGGPVSPPRAGGGVILGGGPVSVAGTVGIVDAKNSVVRFTLQPRSAGGNFDTFVPGSYKLTVFGTTNPPVTAQENGVALDGDFNFLPGGDFTLNFDVSLLFIIERS